jgi:hypothetical protein
MRFEIADEYLSTFHDNNDEMLLIFSQIRKLNIYFSLKYTNHGELIIRRYKYFFESSGQGKFIENVLDIFF